MVLQSMRRQYPWHVNEPLKPNTMVSLQAQPLFDESAASVRLNIFQLKTNWQFPFCLRRKAMAPAASEISKKDDSIA